MRIRKKYATIFGGALKDKTTKEYKETEEISGFLSRKGYTVKNGGYWGIMEAASKGAFESSGETIGITCKSFGYTEGNKYLTETIVADDIFERLYLLMLGSELFVIQKGGIGTLSELFLLFDINRKKNSKIKIFLMGKEYVKLFKLIKPLVNDNLNEILFFCKDFDEFKTKFLY